MLALDRRAGEKKPALAATRESTSETESFSGVPPRCASIEKKNPPVEQITLQMFHSSTRKRNTHELPLGLL